MSISELISITIHGAVALIFFISATVLCTWETWKFENEKLKRGYKPRRRTAGSQHPIMNPRRRWDDSAS